MACFVQVKKTDQLTKGKGAFTDDEQQRIREGLTLYGQNWAEIASHVGGGRSRQQVMHHFKNVMDVMRKGRWSDEEDRQLASVCKPTGCLTCAYPTQRRFRCVLNLPVLEIMICAGITVVHLVI